jgi:hypothetical protein
MDFQNPQGANPVDTSVTETDACFNVGSLVTPVMGWNKKSGLGLR